MSTRISLASSTRGHQAPENPSTGLLTRLAAMFRPTVAPNHSDVIPEPLPPIPLTTVHHLCSCGTVLHITGPGVDVTGEREAFDARHAKCLPQVRADIGGPQPAPSYRPPVRNPGGNA